METVADPGGGRDVPLGLISFIFMQFWQIFFTACNEVILFTGGGGGLCPGGSPPYGKVRAIHILLECILVSDNRLALSGNPVSVLGMK